MTRTIILVVALAAVSGLAIGWLSFGAGPAPAGPTAHTAKKPPVPPDAANALVSAAAPRHEFPLGPDDVANDRETPALVVDGQGRAVVAWAAQSGPLERTLFVACSADGGRHFDAPVPFRKVPIYRFTSQGKGEGRAMTFSTHVLPRLAAAAGGVYLGWVEAVDGGPTVTFRVARSTDGGRSFSEPLAVHGPNARKPGFTALATNPDDSLMAAWLDGRNGGQQPFCATKPADSEGFDTDRVVFAGPEGKGICPCCDVSVVRLPDGSDVVAFRNNEQGFRDIWFARAPKGQAFGPPEPLARDHWKFEGCPHDGPSFALAGDALHVAWMSAQSGKNRVYVAKSSTTALAFDATELSPGTAGAQGHPKLASGHAGQVYAVWDESLDAAGPAPGRGRHAGGHGPPLTGSGRAVMLAVGREGGFGPATAVSPRPGAFQLNPAVAVGRDGAVLVAWSEIDTAGKRVVIAREARDAGGR